MDLRDHSGAIEKLAKNRQKPVSTESGERLAKDLQAVKYLECSALTQKGLKNVFDEAIIAALEPPAKKKKPVIYFRLLLTSSRFSAFFCNQTRLRNKIN